MPEKKVTFNLPTYYSSPFLPFTPLTPFLSVATPGCLGDSAEGAANGTASDRRWMEGHVSAVSAGESRPAVRGFPTAPHLVFI